MFKLQQHEGFNSYSISNGELTYVNLSWFEAISMRVYLNCFDA